MVLLHRPAWNLKVCGDIVIDNHEILDANWFAVSALPDVPGRPTIARRLIDWFIQTNEV